MSTKTTTVTTYNPDGTVLETRDVTWEQPAEQDNRDTIEDQAVTALNANRTFLAIASPTNAQTLAQVKALTRQTNGLIRLVLDRLDGTD